MNQSETIKAVSQKSGMTQANAKAALEALSAVLGENLVRGEEVAVPGGKFQAVERPERQGRNPKTGETVTIKASRGVKFAASVGLKKVING